MERENLGLLLKCTVVPGLPGLFRLFSRRNQSMVFLRSTRRRVILYRPLQPRFFFFFFQSKRHSLKSIFQVTGRILTGPNIDDSFTFLNHTQPIWAKSPDLPRLPSPSDAALSAKLLGHCVLPLSIPIPRTVDAPTGAGNTRSFRLPETFLERHTRVSVQYYLEINVSRGKLRADNWFVQHKFP